MSIEERGYFLFHSYLRCTKCSFAGVAILCRAHFKHRGRYNHRFCLWRQSPDNCVQFLNAEKLVHWSIDSIFRVEKRKKIDWQRIDRCNPSMKWLSTSNEKLKSVVKKRRKEEWLTKMMPWQFFIIIDMPSIVCVSRTPFYCLSIFLSFFFNLFSKTISPAKHRPGRHFSLLWSRWTNNIWLAVDKHRWIQNGKSRVIDLRIGSNDTSFSISSYLTDSDLPNGTRETFSSSMDVSLFHSSA